MFRTIVDKIERDADYPARSFTIDVMNRVLQGALYDHLPHGFHTEKTEAGEYVPLRERRPSVKHNLCRIAVEDSVALLFSEGHFPTPEIDNTDQRDTLLQLVKASRMNEAMLEAAVAGSVGSVAVHMRIFEQPETKLHRIFFETHSTEHLTPTFKLYAPDTLDKIAEQYKVKGDALKEAGYAIADADLPATFWFRREWDASAETWFIPWKKGDEAEKDFALKIDTERTVKHGLGFVPWVWIKNLPGKMRLIDGAPNRRSASPNFSQIDGECTFFAAIDTMVEIDYQLSQGGRGLKYSMDPQLVLKEPPAIEGEMIRGPANALVVDKEGDAKLLELGGSAFKVVLEWVRALREFALEQIHGNRADAHKLSAAQSGRAMELMNQALIWLADKLRVSYGEYGYRRLLTMAVKANAQFPLELDNGKPLGVIDPQAEITLNWPTWFSPTARDLQEQAATIKTLRDAKAISRKTAIANIAFAYDIESVEDELALIDADVKADVQIIVDAKSAQVTEQVRVTE